MGWATLLLHVLLCVVIVTVMIDVWRDIGRIGDLGPGGRDEDLNLLRARMRALRWKLPLLVASFCGVVLLGLFWSPVWRSSVIGQSVLTALAGLAGVNAVLAFAKSARLDWSRHGSFPGRLKAAFRFVLAMGLFVLTLTWVSEV